MLRWVGAGGVVFGFFELRGREVRGVGEDGGGGTYLVGGGEAFCGFVWLLMLRTWGREVEVSLWAEQRS